MDWMLFAGWWCVGGLVMIVGLCAWGMWGGRKP